MWPQQPAQRRRARLCGLQPQEATIVWLLHCSVPLLMLPLAGVIIIMMIIMIIIMIIIIMILIITILIVRGHHRVVAALLRAAADVAARRRSSAPMHIAAANGHLESVALLLAAHGSARTACSTSATFWVGIFLPPPAQTCFVAAGAAALRAAAANGHVAVVDALVEARADVHVANHNRRTAVCSASTTGKLPIVQRLIAERADVNAVDQDGI